MSWRTFIAGAVVAAIGEAIARPVLVSLVRSGLNLQALAADALEQARIETARIQAEAASLRLADAQPRDNRADLEAEIQQLRAELAALKTKV